MTTIERETLEFQLQNRVGPIVNISELSTSDLVAAYDRVIRMTELSPENIGTGPIDRTPCRFWRNPNYVPLDV